MRFFYFLKSIQLLLTLVPLLTLFFTGELCGPFVSNQNLINSLLRNETCQRIYNQVAQANMASPVGAIMDVDGAQKTMGEGKTRVGKILKDILRGWDSLWKRYEDNLKTNEEATTKKPSLVPYHADSGNRETHVNNHNTVSFWKYFSTSKTTPIDLKSTASPHIDNENNSTRKRIFGVKQCVKVKLDDYFAGSPEKADSVSVVLENFRISLIFLICYFAFTFFHFFVRVPLPYRWFSFLLAVVSLFGWGYVLYSMFFMEYDWPKLWMASNLRPEPMSFVLIGEIIAPTVIVFIIIELLFTDMLMYHIDIAEYHRLEMIDDPTDVTLSLPTTATTMTQQWDRDDNRNVRF